jgi:hypothetical protein
VIGVNKQWQAVCSCGRVNRTNIRREKRKKLKGKKGRNV